MSHLEMPLLAYDRVSNKNPFDGEPESGSGWSTEELRWLQVDLRTHVSPHILLALPDSVDDGDYLKDYHCQGPSQVANINAWLGVGWDEVKEGKYDVSVKTFYEELKTCALGQLTFLRLHLLFQLLHPRGIPSRMRQSRPPQRHLANEL